MAVTVGRPPTQAKSWESCALACQKLVLERVSAAAARLEREIESGDAASIRRAMKDLEQVSRSMDKRFTAERARQIGTKAMYKIRIELERTLAGQDHS